MNWFGIVNLFVNFTIPITLLFKMFLKAFTILWNWLFLAARHVLVVLVLESLSFLRARYNLTVELSLWFVQSIFDDVLLILVNINRFCFENILLFTVHLFTVLLLVKAFKQVFFLMTSFTCVQNLLKAFWHFLHIVCHIVHS
jgi:hypothetical protein